MARLIRTEKEVEGRYEEVWLVVEEDALEQWPAGPLEVVGHPATRIDGLERARGEAVYTADLKLPGMLHTAVLRSPYAHARVRSIDLAPALATPGVHAAIGPGELDVLVEECGLPGRRGRGRVRRHDAQARAAPRSDRGRLRAARGADRPRRGGRARAAARRAAGARARRPRARPRRGGRRRRPASTDPGRAAQLDGDPPGRRAVARRLARGLHLDAVHLGRSRRGRRTTLGLPADKVRVVCNYMGGGFGSKNGADDYTFIAIELAKRTQRPVRCALTRREENLVDGQPQRDDPAARRSARAPTARSPRSAATT